MLRKPAPKPTQATPEMIADEVRHDLEYFVMNNRFMTEIAKEVRMAELAVQRMCDHSDISGYHCRLCGANWTGLYSTKRKT